MTAATMLARLLDEHDRRLRFEAGWSAYAADAQAAPSGDWDVTLADGLEREDD